MGHRGGRARPPDGTPPERCASKRILPSGRVGIISTTESYVLSDNGTNFLTVPAMLDQVDGLFDGNVVVLTAAIDSGTVSSLGVHEAAIVQGAVSKRRNEFATGRMLARDGLRRLGVTDFELLHDANRAPIWPRGIAGSLSHCSTRAFVAIGNHDEVGTLGIDTEDQVHLPEELWPLVLVAEERAFLETRPATERGQLALIMFSAKESLYKAQYPWTQALMEFSEIRVDVVQLSYVPHCEGTFACVFQRDVGAFAFGTVVPGRFRYLGPEQVLVTTAQILGGVRYSQRWCTVAHSG